MNRRYIIILIAVLMTSLGGVAQQSADGLVRHTFGASASFDVNIPSGSKGLWATGSGVTVGVDYAYRLTSTWYLATGLGAYYRTFGTDYMVQDNSIYEGTVKNIGLRAPLMVGYEMPIASQVDMSIATGPALEVNLYARESAMPDFNQAGMNPESVGMVNLFKQGFRRVDAIWGIVLGFTFAEHYYVGLAGNVAFTPLAQYGNRDNKLRIRGNSVAIKLCYKF